MFHGQLAVDYGFNTNADMVADNQSDHSLIALRMLHDHSRSYEVGPHNMKVDEKLCQSVKKVSRIFRRTKETEKAGRKRFKKKKYRRRNQGYSKEGF